MKKTREKAEQIIKELWRYEHTDKYTEKEIREALDMAISALYAESCEDCISRADVRRILNHEVKILNVNTWKALYEKIDDLPSVQPIRPKGEWIKGDKSLQCPKCGAKGENIESDFVFNYCPCCGADMRGE